MKASVSFRDDRRPLVRLRLPATVLGLPFTSTVDAGDLSDLQLRLATALSSGPSLRLSLGASTPPSLSLKLGLGPLLSPSSGPLTLSASFPPLSFRFSLKPRLGDFALRTSAATSLPLRKPLQLPAEALAAAEVTARSVMPVTRRAAVEVRWGVRMPSGPLSDEGKPQVPSLRMRKISVEDVGARGGAVEDVEGCLEKEAVTVTAAPPSRAEAGNVVATTKAEANEVLRKAVMDSET